MGGFSVVVLMGILSFIYLFLIAIFVAVVLYIIMSYTFQGISIMCMCKNMGYKNTFTAWIPFYNKYLLGSLAGNKIMGIISGILSFVSICLGIYFYIHKELEIVLFIILIILSIISLFVGVTNISVNDILSFNIDKIQILLISRLPRLIAIIVAGVGLSISGLIMQQISKNKFVSPTTAATADFAKLGILFCIMIIPGATIMQKMIISFIFAGLGTILFMKMIKAIKIKNIIFVPLIGMMLGKIIGSITTFFAYKYDLVQNIS